MGGGGAVPQSVHPRKAPGILQVQAKTNTHALKSPVHNPCVITQAASPHKTKTWEWRQRSTSAHACVCVCVLFKITWLHSTSKARRRSQYIYPNIRCCLKVGFNQRRRIKGRLGGVLSEACRVRTDLQRLIFQRLEKVKRGLDHVTAGSLNQFFFFIILWPLVKQDCVANIIWTS